MDAVLHDAAEELAAHTEALAASADGAGSLALECRRVDRALARDDERSVARTLVEPDQVEYELGACEQFAAESRERGTEPAAGARAGQIPVGRELGHRWEPRLELLDHLRIGPL